MKSIRTRLLLAVIVIISSTHYCFSQADFKGSNRNNLDDGNSSPNFAINKADKKESRYVLITEMFYLKEMIVQSNGRSNSTLSLRVINGFQVNKCLSIGIGVAVETLAIPFSIDFRYSGQGNNSGPVLGLNVGYKLFNNDDVTNQGIRFNPTVGIKKFLSKKTALLLNIGALWYPTVYTYYSTNYYKNGNLTHTSTSSNNTKTDNVFLMFGGGFSF